MHLAPAVSRHVYTVMHQKFGSPRPQQSATRILAKLLTTHNSINMRAFGTEISANRRRKGELSIAARQSIISKAEAGASTTELAEEFSCISKCIRDTLKRYQQTGSNASRARSGRPPILSRREERALWRQARKNAKIQYRELIKETSLRRTISRSTAYRALKREGLTNFRAKRRPKIDQSTARERLQWARTYRDVNWRRLTLRFSDECSVEKAKGQNTEWVFRYPWEKWKPSMITEVYTSRSPAQMVWASIWIDSRGRTQRSPLVIMDRDPDAPRGGYSAQSYIEALEQGLLPNYRPGERFIQDNTRIHTVNKSTNLLISYGI